MKNRRLLFLALGAAGLSAAGLWSCIDVSEPDGPLLVTRLTLKDARSRNATVFSDTSVPQDCSTAENRELPVCKNDIFGDMFGLKKSVPTPDSVRDLRVVFNKLPLKAAGQDTEAALAALKEDPQKEVLPAVKPGVIDLQCAGCSGVPPVRKRLIVFGSDLSLDPRSVPYGPALALDLLTHVRRNDKNEPVSLFETYDEALEPDSEYTVALQPTLAGRDGQALDGAKAQPLLRFRTEPMRLLQAGKGSAQDPWVYVNQDLTKPFDLGEIADDGALALRINTPLDDDGFGAAALMATLRLPSGVESMVPVKLVLRNGAKTGCTTADTETTARRVVYLVPADGKGLWAEAQKGATLTVAVAGALLRDLSQAPGHPAGQGKHQLSGTVTLKATLSGERGFAPAYGGLVWTGGGCPKAAPMKGADMAAPDMTSPQDMATSDDGGVRG